MGFKARRPKHEVTKLEIHHSTPAGTECPGSFRAMLDGVEFCLHCGRLCCGCLISSQDRDVCTPCYEEYEK